MTRASPFPTVEIHYLRLPDREQVFRQLLLLDGDQVKVTLARRVDLDEPVLVGGRVVLEPGADAVWFTYPGAWHDIGRFHLADGTFTGIYANVLTPPAIFPEHRWETTDLFLDLWIREDAFAPGRPASPQVLDRDQLDRAVERGWLAPEVAERARGEAAQLVRLAREGRWPPAHVAEWTRERTLELIRSD